MDVNKGFMRSNIIESLLNNLIYNEKRQQISIKLFEISDVYCFDINNKIKQERRISIVASGRVGKNYKEFSKKIDLKYLNKILQKIPDISTSAKLIPRDNLNSKISNEIVGVEFNISNLKKEILDYKNKYQKKIKTFTRFQQISEFPSTFRDISFLIEDEKIINEFESLIFSFKNINLKETFVFDYYKNIKSNQVKVGIRFVFQSRIKTLKDTDVDDIINDIINIAFSLKGIKIPGLER